MLSVITDNVGVSLLATLLTVDAILLIAGLAFESCWFVRDDGGNNRKLTRLAVAHIVAWTLGPPVWFFVEWYVLHPELLPNATEKVGQLKAEYERLKLGQELAKPIWAAILAAVLFLVPKK